MVVENLVIVEDSVNMTTITDRITYMIIVGRSMGN